MNIQLRFSRRLVSGSAFLAILALFASLRPASAQTTSTIEGTATDKQGLALAGAQVHAEGVSIGADRSTTTDSNGEYRLLALPAGTYRLTVTCDGFRTGVYENLEVTLNRTLHYDARLDVGSSHDQVEVSGELPLLEVESSAQSTTITPREIEDMPINGRNYLDLLQLVPGVAINRHADANTDNATPVLGERANNTGFLIDGLPNQNELNGGAAAQFNQDTIAEFQVITTGYKAEFGHSSGGVVNVLTKSGGNDTHGIASVYHRNNVFDSSDIPGQGVPYLLRWDYDLAAGGAIVKDKAFWFGSAERIHENRQLNFVPPDNTPQFIIDNEERFNEPTTNRETRLFAKFDQVLGNHHLTEQANYTNLHVNSTNPLSASTSLPSTRTNLGDRNLLLGFSDTATLGNSASPFILSLRGQYRSQSTLTSAAHPEAGPDTIFNLFSGFDTGGVFGDLATPEFGATFTPSNLNQEYGTFGASLAKTLGHHTIKFGWDFERTQVDGVEANGQQNQLFATQADYEQFGPVDAGFFLLLTTGGLTPEANKIKLRNNYNGLWIQDDWKLTRGLTLNGGVRWDYDSAFNKTDNISPRIGFAWSLNSKTVVRGSFGIFYDHFRLGLARDIPGFGGADIRLAQPLSFPRLFFGVPTIAPALFGVCQSTSLTDAQIAAAGATCPFAGAIPGDTSTLYGIDHLNNLGPNPIPANSPVNIGTVQQLSGLPPDQFLAAADAAIAKPSGFWFWGPFGTLSFNVLTPGSFPVTIDPSFATPYTRSYTLGVQRQLSDDWVISADYYHKGIDNLLGVRQTNLPFDARITGITPSSQVNGFGPWYSGLYDAGILSFTKRMRKRFTLGGSYAFVSEHDDALNYNLGTGPLGTSSGGNNGYPTDSFRGIIPVVTDPGSGACTGQTNTDHSFTACNGASIPKAGTFYDGAKLDSGPSDLALRHTLELHGLVELPWQIQFSSLFRAQSGFRYTAVAEQPVDVDANGTFNGRDLKTGRNAFIAPRFVNMDLRIAKTWPIGDRFKIQGLFEFFNLFNNANPAAIQIQQAQAATFGTVSQTLPGREGQVGLRLTF